MTYNDAGVGLEGSATEIHGDEADTNQPVFLG